MTGVFLTGLGEVPVWAYLLVVGGVPLGCSAIKHGADVIKHITTELHTTWRLRIRTDQETPSAMPDSVQALQSGRRHLDVDQAAIGDHVQEPAPPALPAPSPDAQPR